MEIKVKKISKFDIVTIVSCIGMIGWFLTEFYGGMILYLLAYGQVIVPIILIYIICLICMLISLCRKGIGTNKVRLIFHGMVMLVAMLINIAYSETFKSERVLTATLKDDLFHYTLVFRKNGMVENQINGFLGYTQTIKGEYYTKGDTIIFTKKPYENNFIPDTMLVDRDKKAIFMNKNEAGEFATEKTWLNYFEIHP